MARDFLPPIGGDRRGPSGVIVYAVLALLIVGLGGLAYMTRFRWVTNLQGRVAQLEVAAERAQAQRDEMASEVDALTREVAGMRAVNDVEIIFGGEEEPLDRDAVKLPYKRQGSVLVHRTSKKSLYYFTGEGETLADVAAHPGTLGAWYLWPVLKEENNLKGRGSSELPPRTLLKVPTRLGDWRVRAATTAAGTPDAVRSEIFKQAGIQ